MDRRWYVVHTQPNCEAAVCQWIEEKQLGVFLPMEECVIKHARRTQIVNRPLFRGYLFSEFDLQREDWESILTVVGVQTILGIKKQYGIPTLASRSLERVVSRPIALREDVIPGLKAFVEQGQGIVRLKQKEELQRLKKDDRVKIGAGPLAGLEGLVANDNRRRVWVLLDMIGKKNPISLPRESVELIA